MSGKSDIIELPSKQTDRQRTTRTATTIVVTHHGIPVERNRLVGSDGLGGALLVSAVGVGLALDGHDAARPGETQVPTKQ